MTPPFVRSPYNYDVTAASDEAAYVETMPSLTVQSQTEDSDLNVMMKRFGVTGQFPENPRVPEYGDFSEITDFRSALQAVRDAEEKFGEFPAEVRARFQNDPQRLLEFASVPGNEAEGVRLGLWKARPPGEASGSGGSSFAAPGSPGAAGESVSAQGSVPASSSVAK